MTLVGALADKEPFVRWQAGRTLASLGSRAALDALLQALRTPPVARQAAAAEALGSLRDRRAVPALLEAARGQNAGVRVSAVEAMGRIGGSDAVPVLLELLRDESAGVRRAAAWALGELRERSAMDALLVRLADAQEHVLVRRTAAWSLGRMALKPDTFGVLARSLDDPDPQIRWHVAYALGRNRQAALNESVREGLLAHLDDTGEALQGQVGDVARQAVRRLRWRGWCARLSQRRHGSRGGS
jgi:HEAT repeat protein